MIALVSILEISNLSLFSLAEQACISSAWFVRLIFNIKLANLKEMVPTKFSNLNFESHDRLSST